MAGGLLGAIPPIKMWLLAVVATTLLSASLLPYSSAQATCDCTDNAPDDKYSCQQQKDFGKCDSDWLKAGSFCSKTCGRCSCDAAAGKDQGAKPALAESSTAPKDTTAAGQPAAQKEGKGATAKAPQAAAQPAAATPPPPPAGKPAAAGAAAGGGEGAAAGPSSGPSGGANSVDLVYPCDGGTTVSSVVSMDTAQLSTLRQALHWAGLQGRLNNPALNITLFMPTNEAFAALAADSNLTVPDLLTNGTLLRSVLLYHLVPRALSPQDLRRTPAIDTYWAGQQLFGLRSDRISGGAGTDARIVKSVKVCNSYLYYIDYVLLPSDRLDELPPFVEAARAAAPAAASNPQCASNGTLWDVLLAVGPNVTFTISAITNAGLVGRLSNVSASGLTLFAPADIAWGDAARRLGKGSPQDLLALDKATLSAILLGHVVPRYLPPSAIANQIYATLAPPPYNQPLFLDTRGGSITLQSPSSDAVVITPNAAASRACSAAVHVIDQVLLPAQLLPAAAPAPPAEAPAPTVAAPTVAPRPKPASQLKRKRMRI